MEIYENNADTQNDYCTKIIDVCTRVDLQLKLCKMIAKSGKM